VLDARAFGLVNIASDTVENGGDVMSLFVIFGG